MFRRKKNIWPQPELSVGRRFPCNFSSSGHCWEAVGPARDAFNEVAEKIKELFESQSDYLDEGEEVTSTFSYGIWMVGSDETRATPTIVLGCKSLAVRTKAKDILKQSGLLDPFPGIALKKSSSVPEPFAAHNEGTSNAEASESVSANDPDVIYTYEGAHDQCGIRIVIIPHDIPPTQQSRVTTMGRFVLVDGIAHGLTVAHAFNPKFQPPTSTNHDVLVFDEDSDPDTVSFIEQTSKGKCTCLYHGEVAISRSLVNKLRQGARRRH